MKNYTPYIVLFILNAIALFVNNYNIQILIILQGVFYYY